MNFEHKYSDGLCKKKIAILGIMPPPYGGVSVHVRRVADKLIDQGNSVCLFNIEQRLRSKFFTLYLIKLFAWLLLKRPDILYYHGTYNKNCVLELISIRAYMVIFSIKLIIVDHDARHLYKRTRLFKWLYRKIIAKAQVISIGSLTHKSYSDNAMPMATIIQETAFLPPSNSMKVSIKQTYPSSLIMFIEQFTPLILMNGAHIMVHKGGDVYGFDNAVGMLAGIKKVYPDAGLIMAIATINDSAYMEQLYNKMHRLGIAEQIFILQDQKELWPLFEQVDLFIRPTLSDGASISLYEACYFNVPAVASDVCVRPLGVTLFKKGDLPDLIRAVEFELDKLYAKTSSVSADSYKGLKPNIYQRK